MIYLLVFSISCLLIAIGEKKNKLFLVLGLALPILLAAMRDETVGIDIHTYVTPTFDNAKSSYSFLHFALLNKSILSTRDLEYGFTFISYLATKFFGGLWGVLFVYDLIMVLCIYYSIIEFNKTNLLYSEIGNKIKIWHGMYVYYMLFYNMSLTMIRQSLACSLVLLGVILFINKKTLKSIICIIIAMSFHSTALISITIIAMYLLLKMKKRIIQKIIFTIGVIVFVLGGQGYWVALNLLNNLVTVSGRYLSYTYMWLQGNGVNLAWLYMIVISVLSILYLYKKHKNLINQYFLYLSLWSIFLFPLSVVSANAGRIEYYFMYFFIISTSMMPVAFKNVRWKGKQVSVYLMLVFGLVYWLGTTGLNDSTGTVNYELAFYK